MVRKEQLSDAWDTHNSINFLLIDAATYARMQKSLSTRGDRTIYQQCIHIHNTRMQWLEICARDIFKKYSVLNRWAAFERKSL